MSPRETINIQDPPVREIHKQRSCIKRGCFSGCGCSIFLFIGVLILLNIVTGAGTNTVKSLPEILPKDISIYEEQRIDTIRVSDPIPTGPLATITSYIPKVLLASVYLSLGENSPTEVSRYYTEVTVPPERTLSYLWALLQVPITPPNQFIELTWHPLSANQSFIATYYIEELKRAGYTITRNETVTNGSEIDFKKDAILGTILVKDTDPEHNGTEFITMRVSVPRN
jgi:hypothetical protein